MDKALLKRRIDVMGQICYCSKCRATVSLGDRFCGNCGISLNWVAQPMTTSSLLPSYGYQYPGRQQGLRQQPGWGQPLPYNQVSAWGNPNQYQRQVIYDNRGAILQKKNLSSNTATMTPMRVEISKLLEEFFSEPSKCRKPG